MISLISVIPFIAYFSNKSMLQMRLREFENGKMDLYSSKIDQDTVKNVKRKILKNNSLC